MKDKNKVLVIYTGGTMGMIYDLNKKSLVPFDIKQILNHIPELERLRVDLDFVAFDKPLDSSNIGPSHWLELASLVFENFQKYSGFVILHGTDTMAYSASALSFLLENLSKPIVFTGAQLPISEVRSDARENFITAIEIASAYEKDKAIVPEVCIYFDYFLLRGNRSRKVQSSHFDAFVSQNYNHLAKAGIKIEYNYDVIVNHPKEDLKLYKELNENLVILKLFPGISEAAVQSTLDIPGIKGVVLETFGAGNAPTDTWLISAMEKAIEKGVVILNVSQCLGGNVEQGKYATSKELERIGVISGGDITTEAAVTKLMFVLGNEPFKSEPKKWLIASIRGEKN